MALQRRVPDAGGTDRARAIDGGYVNAADDNTIRAAGGVVWRAAPAPPPAGLEIVVVHRPKYGDWSLPKGKLDPGETWQDAAVREVREETGYPVVELGPFLDQVEYVARDSDPRSPRRKQVRYWAMRAGPGSFTPGTEVDEIRWLPAPAAIDLLSYDRDRELVHLFLSRITGTR